MRFLIDAQLPPALAHWLIDQGHEAEHVADVQMQSASDAMIWRYASETAAVILTKDEDFAERRVLSDEGPSIVWIRQPNARRRAILAWFARALPDIVSALERGETLIEIV